MMERYQVRVDENSFSVEIKADCVYLEAGDLILMQNEKVVAQFRNWRYYRIMQPEETVQNAISLLTLCGYEIIDKTGKMPKDTSKIDDQFIYLDEGRHASKS
jgi:hypothetical protein